MSVCNDIIARLASDLAETGAQHIYIGLSNDGVSLSEFDALQSRMLLLFPSIVLRKLRAFI